MVEVDVPRWNGDAELVIDDFDYNAFDDEDSAYPAAAVFWFHTYKTLGSAANQLAVLWNTCGEPVISARDSFNSLTHVSEATFWVVATVLRFLRSGMRARKYGNTCDSFNSLDC